MSESSTQEQIIIRTKSYSQTVYKQHEDEKKRKYLDHVINVEKCSFTPLVFTTHGGQAPEAQIFHKRLATLLARKRNILYIVPCSIRDTKNKFCHKTNCCNFLKRLIDLMSCFKENIDIYLDNRQRTVSKDLSEAP